MILRRVSKNRSWIANVLAIVFLGVCFLLSMAKIRRTHEQVYDPTKKNLRIAHWQLELGFREGLDRVIEEYERLHPDVSIEQVAINEQFYLQVMNTHLVGGTAPDMIEIGQGMQKRYIPKYFDPVSSYIRQVNPYNAGTDLEHVPWQDTFIDGMRGSYMPETGEYYGIPVSSSTVRIFYNKDLFERVTGSDRPPQTFERMMDICRRIEAYADRHDLTLVPIAGSRYNSPIFFSWYRAAFLSQYQDVLDVDLSGVVDPWELYLGLRKGKVHWDDPINRAAYELILELSQHFQKGFMAVYREQAAFLFVQGRAAMMTTGSWDAGSVFRQADFRVGIFNFPLPTRNGRYGPYVRGRPTEATAGTGSGFGVCRFSRHKDVAIDFLQFLTCRRVNERFTRAIDWIPGIIAAQPRENLKVFLPDPTGFTGGFSWTWGTPNQLLYHGAEAQFVQGEITFEQFGQKVLAGFEDPQQGWRRGAQQTWGALANGVTMQERLLAILDGNHLFTGAYGDYPQRHKDVLIRQVRADYKVKSYQDRYRKQLNLKVDLE